MGAGASLSSDPERRKVEHGGRPQEALLDRSAQDFAKGLQGARDLEEGCWWVCRLSAYLQWTRFPDLLPSRPAQALLQGLCTCCHLGLAFPFWMYSPFPDLPPNAPFSVRPEKNISTPIRFSIPLSCSLFNFPCLPLHKIQSSLLIVVAFSRMAQTLV